MAESAGNTTQVQLWLERLQGGDAGAREELLHHFCDQLQRLTRTMLRGYPGVKRWEQTDDVFQGAMLRLLRALKDVPVASARHFMALAATQIRRELVDLARHYYGPQGPGAHHASNAAVADSERPPQAAYERADITHETSRLLDWSEFHQQAAALPDQEREVFDLLWYQGLSQAEAAALLGVTERTIKRRWQSVRLKLHEALQGELPPL